ncbi:hypothetical protein LTR16_000969 [Cryomyces antarcticus]|uniref:Quinate repressor protein n=1 Tax=Cryomyces antarcticus TaxID=329879 RepID=A0ABR0KUA2_9PEZI|nr:hypothetical protein LTR16_000969 [Cryomyces antarcticus]
MAHRKLFGVAEHQRRQTNVLRETLIANEKGCVIVCSPGSIERSGQALLREYAKTHPVVHIVRDAKSIRNHLKIWDEEKIDHLLGISGSIFRTCSNLEFYNLSESRTSANESLDYLESQGHNKALSRNNLAGQASPPTPFLTLKRAERDFLKFLNLATSKTMSDSSLESFYPLARVATEARTYTHAISVPLSFLTSTSIELEDIVSATDAFELVVDDLDRSRSPHPLSSARADQIGQAVASIRRHAVIPIIYHVAIGTKNDGPGEHKDYVDRVLHGLRLAPEYATIDLSLSDDAVARLLAVKGNSKIIGNAFFPDRPSCGWDDPRCFASYERAMALGCDLVKLSIPANSIDDNFAVQRFRSQVAALPSSRIPLVAYNTGRLGRMSVCFNPIFTPVTHQALVGVYDRDTSQQVPEGASRSAMLDLGRTTSNDEAPLVTACEANQALYSSFILDPMHFYIYGASVNYSLSPAMHNAAYRICGMPHDYKTSQATSLKGLYDLVSDPNFGGAAITQPYKIEVIALTHSLSRHAKAIGAVNTLIPIRNLPPNGGIPDDLSFLQERNHAGPVKALYGDNTDWIGIRVCLRRGLSPVNAVRNSSSGLVIGAGGMARAAVYAMIQMGVKNIFIHNRTFENAEKLAAHYNRLDTSSFTPQGPAATVRVIRSYTDAWPEEHRLPTMVVCCIPANSIDGQPAANFVLPSKWLKSPTGGVVIEVR